MPHVTFYSHTDVNTVTYVYISCTISVKPSNKKLLNHSFCDQLYLNEETYFQKLYTID